jgi:hypothetical protein
VVVCLRIGVFEQVGLREGRQGFGENKKAILK